MSKIILDHPRVNSTCSSATNFELPGHGFDGLFKVKQCGGEEMKLNLSGFERIAACRKYAGVGMLAPL